MLLLPFFIFSCTPKNEVEKMLTAEDSKWVHNNSLQFDPGPGFLAYMKFEGDSCINCDITTGKPFDSAPANRSVWQYRAEDSILDIMGHIRKVSKAEGDTLFLLNPENGVESMLVRVR